MTLLSYCLFKRDDIIEFFNGFLRDLNLVLPVGIWIFAILFGISFAVWVLHRLFFHREG